jgi:integrase
VASIIERGGRWRALIRKAGHTRCETFSTRKAAARWAARVEDEIEQLQSTGAIAVPHKTVADLIDRYIEEVYPRKRWGRSKAAYLERTRADLGTEKVGELTTARLIRYFSDRARKGAGGVTVSAQFSYLLDALKTARGLWHWDVPLQAAQDARLALGKGGLAGKSNTRDRRVSDAEIEQLKAHFAAKPTDYPMGDILEFCMASAMRISEVCRLQWADLNEADKTILIRDRKHPREKFGNNQTVPLLAATGYDAFAVVTRQPRGGLRIFPYNEKTVSNYVTRAVTALGLTDLRLHDLRHEAISRLFAAGYQIQEVSLVSGHRDWAMLKRYTHVRAADLHRERAK